MAHPSRWDDPEMDEILRKGAGDGLSAAQIAMRLPAGFTKNMVVGRARRIDVKLGQKPLGSMADRRGGDSKTPGSRERYNEMRRKRRAKEKAERATKLDLKRDYKAEEARTEGRKRINELPPTDFSTSTFGAVDALAAPRFEPDGYEPAAGVRVEENPSTTYYGVEATIKLRRNQCRFPFGQPNDVDFHYCQQRKLASSAYCQMHRDKTFQPSREPPSRSKAKRTHYRVR